MKKPLLWIPIALTLLAGSAHAGFHFMGYDFGPPCHIEIAQQISGNPQDLYERAKLDKEKGHHCEAAQKYFAITQLANDQLFHEAMFHLIGALHSAGEYDSSITAAKQYLRWHPVLSQERTEYAVYIIGVNFFLERNGVLQDQRETQMAQLAFADYLEKYPRGKYREQALEYMRTSYDELAKRELEVGKYYLARREFTAAAGRLQQIPIKYKNSTYLAEALFLISIAYTAIEKDKEAAAVQVLLNKLFPESNFAVQTSQFLTEVRLQRTLAKEKNPSVLAEIQTCGVLPSRIKCIYPLEKALAKLEIELSR